MNDPTQGSTPTPPQLTPRPTFSQGGVQGFPKPSPQEDSVLFTCPNCLLNVTVKGDPAARIDQQCPTCRHNISIRSFPRLTQEPPAKQQSLVAGGADATCQFYPELKAEVVCDECGCFMSRKAAVDWGGKTLCMPCLHNLRENKVDTEYRAELKIWDNRALGLLAMLPITLFTGPIALFLLLRFRKEPRGWIPRSSFRWWLALFLSLAIMAGWIALIVGMVALLSVE